MNGNMYDSLSKQCYQNKPHVYFFLDISDPTIAFELQKCTSTHAGQRTLSDPGPRRCPLVKDDEGQVLDK